MFVSRKLVGSAAAVVVSVMAASSAHAHFILLKPDSQYNQRMGAFGGDPQKLAPCGPGDGEPGTASNKVTEVKAGSMLAVTWEITVPHPGYFRVALDKDPTKFTEPPYTDDVECTIDLTTIPKGAHDNVLMDGIDPEATMAMVKIPDEPCDDCTLQVIQAMKDHGPPNCTYYHCAKLKILPKDGATAGAGGNGGSGGSAGSAAGTGGAGGSAGAAGSAGAGGLGGSGGSAGSGSAGTTSAAGSTGAPAGSSAPPAAGTVAPPVTQPVAGAAAPTPSTESEDSGCAVARVGGPRASAGWLALGLALSAFGLRRGHYRRRLASR
jgi:hypothetical protein